MVYLDDIVLYGNTIEANVQHLKKILQVNRENELHIKQEKCEFAQH